MEFLPGMSLLDLQQLCDDLDCLMTGHLPALGTEQDRQEEVAELCGLLELNALPGVELLAAPDDDLLARLEAAGLAASDLWAVAPLPLAAWAVVAEAMDVLATLEELDPHALQAVGGLDRVEDQLAGLFTLSLSPAAEDPWPSVQIAAGTVLDALTGAVTGVVSAAAEVLAANDDPHAS